MATLLLLWWGILQVSGDGCWFCWPDRPRIPWHIAWHLVSCLATRSHVWSTCTCCQFQGVQPTGVVVKINYPPLQIVSTGNDNLAVLVRNCYDKDLHDWIFIYFYMYWYWSHCDSHLHLSTGLWPHCSCDSCAAHCCDSELHSTVHCDLLLQWHYCSCDAYCSRYSIVLLEYLVKLAG